MNYHSLFLDESQSKLKFPSTFNSHQRLQVHEVNSFKISATFKLEFNIDLNLQVF